MVRTLNISDKPKFRVDYVADVFGTLLLRVYVHATDETEARKFAYEYKPTVCPTAFACEVMKVVA